MFTTSSDGTTIAFERHGDGPAVILVDAVMFTRQISPLQGIADHLAADFTVYTYDRRGRGESGDTAPYAVRREVEDLDALIHEAGGSACVYGFSSGALLALNAAAAGSSITRLVVFEPPIGSDDDETPDVRPELVELVAAGRRGDAVRRFHESIGVPEEVMASMDGIAPTFEATAHTIVYDLTIGHETSLALMAEVSTPTLVIDSSGSDSRLPGWSGAVAAALPAGRHRSLPGDWHGVADEVLAPAIADFFRLA